MPPRAQRFRPVLKKDFIDGLHRRGVDVDAVRIEPGAPACLTPCGAGLTGPARRLLCACSGVL